MNFIVKTISYSSGIIFANPFKMVYDIRAS